MSAPEQQACILVVDDDPTILFTYRRGLEKMGHQVIVAKTGEEAFAGALSYNPDLILLDIRLPDTDGNTVCAKLRQTFSVKVPILMVTSVEDDETVTQAFEAGASDYITKPIHWSVFRHRIANLLKTKRAEDELLTGLPNRRLFSDRLGQAIRFAERQEQVLAVLFLDLDKFKLINDTYGHRVG